MFWLQSWYSGLSAVLLSSACTCSSQPDVSTFDVSMSRAPSFKQTSCSVRPRNPGDPGLPRTSREGEHCGHELQSTPAPVTGSLVWRYEISHESSFGTKPEDLVIITGPPVKLEPPSLPMQKPNCGSAEDLALVMDPIHERSSYTSQSTAADRTGTRGSSSFGMRTSLEMAIERLESQDITLPHSCGDGLGVPWFDGNKAGAFVHTYFVPRSVCEEGNTYQPKMNGDVVDYHFDIECARTEDLKLKYPQPAYDRRLTLNNWRIMLIESFADAALRLTNLLANVQLAFLMFENEKYREFPVWIRSAFCTLLFLAIILWILNAWRSQIPFNEFIHPDTRFQEAYTFVSAVILEMFAIPKDVILLPLHVVPMSQGGLLSESAHIRGERNWPVHTICHQDKLDHDYVNTSGLAVQLPLFILVDIGCSIINVYISFSAGIFNYTALLQVVSSFAYSFLKIRQAWTRHRVRREILELWLTTACDELMKPSRRENAVRKYLAAGGNKAHIEQAIRKSGLKDRHTALNLEWVY